MGFWGPMKRGIGFVRFISIWINSHRLGFMLWGEAFCFRVFQASGPRDLGNKQVSQVNKLRSRSLEPEPHYEPPGPWMSFLFWGYTFQTYGTLLEKGRTSRVQVRN